MATIPSLPARASTDWYAYAQGLDTAARGAALVADVGTSVTNLNGGGWLAGRALIGAALAGTGLCKVGVLGDSTSAGVGSANSREQSWPAFLATLLNARGLTKSGTGPLNWSQFPLSTALGLGGGSISNSGSDQYTTLANSGAAPLTATGRGTVFELLYANNNTNPFTYTIDGAAPVTVTPANTNSIAKLTVTGLSDAQHTVSIAQTGGGFGIYWSAEFRYPTGLVVGNLSQNGKSSTDWASTTNWYDMLNWAKAWAPNILVLPLGINDWILGTSTAQYQANLGKIIDQISPATAVLVVPIPSNPAHASGFRTDYDAAVYALAATRDLAVVDLTQRMHSWAAGSALGLYSDDLHMTPAGYAANAPAFLPLFE